MILSEQYQVLEDNEEESSGEGKLRSSRKYNLFKILMLYIVIGFSGWIVFSFMFTSSWFDVSRITFRGNYYLSKDAILEQAEIKGSHNIFHLDIKGTREKILKNPWVQEAVLKKVLPNHLDINIKERKPGALIYAHNRYYLVTEEGIILERFEQLNTDFRQYLITGLDVGNRRPGEVIDNREYLEIQRIIYGLDNLFPGQFYKIQIISKDEFLIFHSNNKIKVRIENGEQLINEWYLLESALQKVNQEEIPLQEINMKYKERLLLILKE